MSRYISPVPRYFANDGSILAYGKLHFKKSGTNSDLDTFSDNLLSPSLKNTNPVILTASGRAPNIFYDGSAKVILKDVNDVQIWERDPVGADNITGDFSTYDNLIIYSINDITEASDGLFYISLVNDNQGNDPITPSPTKWSQIRFIGVYNSSESYVIGDVVQESDGTMWRSLTNPNLANTPSTDNGTNWKPAISSANVLVDTNTVIPHTGGGLLSALRINELRDGNTGYLLPLAASVLVNQTITINLPLRYAIGAVVTRTGADTIEGASSDTSITFNGDVSVELTSDGISTWTL